MKRTLTAGGIVMIVYVAVAWRLVAPAAVPAIAPLTPLSVVAVQHDDPHADATPETRTYDVTEALRKLGSTNPQSDATTTLRSYLIAAQIPHEEIDDRLEVTDDPGVGTGWRLTASAVQHTAFEGLLEGLELAGEQQVATQTWRLELPNIEALGPIDWDGAIRFREVGTNASAHDPPPVEGEAVAQSTSESYTPYLSVVLSEEQTDALWTRLRSGGVNLNVLSAPKVTTFSGQRATVSDQVQRPFVLGVTPVVGEFATAYQPQIHVFREGFRSQVRALVLESGRIDLECEASVTRIEGAESYLLPGYPDVAIHSPECTRDAIRVRQELASGESLLVAPRVTKRDSESNVTCVLVQPQVIELP